MPVIEHLAKQLGNGKYTTKLNECGRRHGVEGSIRMLPLDRFIHEAVKHGCACKQCLSKAIAKNLIPADVLAAIQ